MALRFYFVTVTGTGTTADPFRPVARQGVQFAAADGRPDLTASAGEFAVVFDLTPAQHAALVGTGGVTYLPFEDAGGSLVGPSQPVSQVSGANRSTITTACDARHIPTHDVDGSDLVKKVWRRALVRLVLRQLLGPDDWTEGLDTLVSAIPVGKRQAITAKLTAAGFDTSDIQGSDTVREAIRKIASQLVRLSRTPND